MPTYRLDIEYLGTDWYGWQIQPDHPTVQGAVETALETALRVPVSITGSGRTDTGVHASGQVAHLILEKPADPFRLLASVNGLLPASIAVTSIREVRPDFHARYDARSRQYRYRIGLRPLAIENTIRWYLRPAPDLQRMNLAAGHLLGQHDFSSFCRTQSETENRVCRVDTARWDPTPEGHADFVIRADRFLHGMVRAIVGTLVEVGQGKRDPNELPSLLAARDRTVTGFAAPPGGLMLEQVRYPDDPDDPDDSGESWNRTA
ncbi:MAG: tRNA pseudouridine(38-40) synthase TruA [Bacteroidetes bacterium]|nr:tRNA pseudouridine(38-40) synthase TruA [Bacteroidota bacterium]